MTHHQESLLSRRVPREEIIPGRAYRIHGRRGKIGVADLKSGILRYRIRRVKFGHVFLDTEIDWSDDPTFGTAIPLQLLSEDPPTEDEALLEWLAEMERVHS